MDLQPADSRAHTGQVGVHTHQSLKQCTTQDEQQPQAGAHAGVGVSIDPSSTPSPLGWLRLSCVRLLPFELLPVPFDSPLLLLLLPAVAFPVAAVPIRQVPL